MLDMALGRLSEETEAETGLATLAEDRLAEIRARLAEQGQLASSVIPDEDTSMESTSN